MISSVFIAKSGNMPRTRSTSCLIPSLPGGRSGIASGWRSTKSGAKSCSMSSMRPAPQSSSLYKRTTSRFSSRAMPRLLQTGVPPGMRKWTAVELEGKEQVRQLRLSVGAPAAVAALGLEVVEVDAAHAVRAAAHSHHPRVVAAGHPVEQQAGEREVGEVVGAELELEPVACKLPRLGSHDARVVDEQVEAIVCPREPLREPANRSEAAKVERANLDLRARHTGLDRAGGFRSLLGVADGEDDARAGAGEPARGEEADAAVGTCDDGHAAVLVRDICGGPFVGHGAIMQPERLARYGRSPR